MELMEQLSANNKATLDKIDQSGKLDEKTEIELKNALESFTKTFSK